MRIRNQALLTGAGFSCNVGGFSGDKFLTRLSNHPKIKEDNRITEVLYTKDADYESIYRTVIEDGGFDEDNRDTIITVYEDAYLELDRSICSRCNSQPPPLNLNHLSTFLDWFAGDKYQKERGHIFTLNQDLFLERGYHGSVNLGIPGITYPRIQRHWVPLMDWEAQGHGQLPIHVIPDQEEVNSLKDKDNRGLHVPQKLQYIKLHGSMNWRMNDGSPVMVIAGRKLEHIQSIPLLTWYFEKFSEALATPDMHLCVIGYGFGDPHINEILTNAIVSGTLVQISIIHPRKTRADLETLIQDKNIAIAAGNETATRLIETFRRGQLFDFDLQEAFSSNGPITSTDAGKRLLKTFGPR